MKKKTRYILSIFYLKLFSLIGKAAAKIKKIPLKLRARADNIVNADGNKQDICETQETKACHFNQLYITHNGEVFPCCVVWMKPEMKIGHICDSNLFDSVRNFFSPCSCWEFKLRKGLADEKIDIDFLYIEVSLGCQGKCAMCGVNAPPMAG